MRRRRLVGIVGTGLVLAGGAAAWSATAARAPGWKGAEWLSVSAPAINLDRCGSPVAQRFELHFAGSGIDTVGGPFTVKASACIDMATLRVTDLKATDRFTATGDTVEIETADFVLRKQPSSCVATNRRPVKFSVAGGTGGLAGATGGGTFHTAVALAGCDTPSQPAYVWFKGRLERPD